MRSKSTGPAIGGRFFFYFSPTGSACCSVGLTAAGRALREGALDIPPAVMSRLGMDVGELLALHGQLTAVIARTADEGARPGS